MDPTVILIAPPEVLPVQAVLMDWSSLGMVRDFLWVDASSVAGHGPVPCLKIRDGKMFGTVLQDELPGGNARVRICVLVAFGNDDVTVPAQQGVLAAVQSAGQANPVPIRVLLPRDIESGSARLAERGWHNIVASPETSRGPGGSVIPLDFEEGARLERHEAAVIAGLTGLWAQTPNSPLDGEVAAAEPTLRLARVQVRSWEGKTADDRLSEKTLEVGPEVPISATAAGSLTHVSEDAALAYQMAEQLWAIHAPSFSSPRAAAAVEQDTQKSIWEILKLFWSFLVSGLLNPKQWFAAALSGVQSRAAEKVGQILLGDDSSIDVVWGHSEVPQMDDLTKAASELSSRLTTRLQLPPLEPASDFPGVWEDYAAAAMTMVDGQDRGQFKAPKIGRQVGVVRLPGAVVPEAKNAFTEIGASLDVDPDLRRVAGYDPLAQRRLVRQLDDLAERDQLGGSAVNSRRSLERWMANTASMSYAARFGQKLSDQLEAHRQEVSRLTEAFTSLSSSDAGMEEISRQRSLASSIRRILLVGLLVVVALVVLIVVSLISLPVAIGLIVLTVLATVGAAAATFVRRQQKLFAAIHRREQLARDAEIHRHNLRLALRDIVRCSAAYEQFLSWSRVLGEFVHRPFGRWDATHGERELILDLPESVFFGSLKYRESEQLGVASRLRDRIFKQGWLALPFKAMLHDAGRVTGPDAFLITDNPKTLFRERSGGPGSILDRWATALTQKGVGRAAADETWAQASDGPLQEVLNQSGTKGVVLDCALRERQPDAVVAGMADMRNGQHFDVRILDGQAVAEGLNAVAGEPWMSETKMAGSTELVRMEFSHELTVRSLKFRGKQVAVEEIDGEVL